MRRALNDQQTSSSKSFHVSSVVADFGQQEIKNLLCKELKHVIKAPQDQTIEELLLAY